MAMLGRAVARSVARGGVGALYRGYGATLLSFGTFSGLYFALYEECKAALGGGPHPPFHAALGAALHSS